MNDPHRRVQAYEEARWTDVLDALVDCGAITKEDRKVGRRYRVRSLETPGGTILRRLVRWQAAVEDMCISEGR